MVRTSNPTDDSQTRTTKDLKMTIISGEQTLSLPTTQQIWVQRDNLRATNNYKRISGRRHNYISPVYAAQDSDMHAPTRVIVLQIVVQSCFSNIYSQCTKHIAVCLLHVTYAPRIRTDDTLSDRYDWVHHQPTELSNCDKQKTKSPIIPFGEFFSKNPPTPLFTQYNKCAKELQSLKR